MKLFMLLSVAWCGLVNAAPVVSNVTAAQQEDKTVAIHYKLVNDTPCTVALQASNDLGATWQLPIKSVVGDVGAGVKPGENAIVWNCKADISGMTGSAFKVRLCAEAEVGPTAPPGMLLIPAGDFLMGDSPNAEGDVVERPAHLATVRAYFMDATPVTNSQYAEGLHWAMAQSGLVAVANGLACKVSDTTIAYCDTTTSSPYSRIVWNGTTFGVKPGFENHPVTMVSWYGAAAYANWRSGMRGKPVNYDTASWKCNFVGGYRLPTEAEWERATRGGAVGHRFPWTATDNLDEQHANYYSSGAPFYDLGPKGFNAVSAGAAMPYTSPVGSFPANAYGLSDMAGNAFEWCNDWFAGDYYASGPKDNPRGPATGTYRVLRGGSWSSSAQMLRCAYRSNALPNYKAITNGFRLVLEVQ